MNVNRFEKPMVARRLLVATSAFILSVMLSVSGLAGSPSRSKRIVQTPGDLPQFTYSVAGTAHDLLATDDATFVKFARRVSADLETIFRDCEVRDKGVLISLLSHKVDLQTLLGDDSGALATCEEMRALFDKPDLKAMGMFNDLTFLRTRMATGQSRGSAFQAEFAKRFRSQVESLPWDVVGERIKNRRAKFEKLSVEYVDRQVETEIEPSAIENHALDFSKATRLIYWRGELLTEVPQREVVLAILAEYINAHESARPTAPPTPKP